MDRGDGILAAACAGALSAVLAVALAACAPAGTTAGRGRTTAAPHEATAAPTITVSGTTLPLAGTVPFLDVIAAADDPRVIVVQADPDRTVGISCVRTVKRAVVREAPRTVSVLIAAYARQPPPGTGCDGEGDRDPVRIRLASPLGKRTLIDEATGRRHPVLDPATVPTLSAAPASFEAEPLRWDDRTGLVIRRWSSGDRSVWLTVGQLGRLEAGAPLPSRTGRHVTVGPAGGTVWHGGGPYDVVVVRWRLPDGRGVEVRTVEERPSSGSVGRAVALARAVR